jgi:hypothetical protein
MHHLGASAACRRARDEAEGLSYERAGAAGAIDCNRRWAWDFWARFERISILFLKRRTAIVN